MNLSEFTSNDIVMNSLSERLVETLSKTSFDLKYARNGKRTTVTKRGLTASELAEVCHEQGHGIISKREYVLAPEIIMSQLVEELRSVLGRFIDPDSDRIGHAFPIDSFDPFGSRSLHTARPDGLSDFEFVSSVENFANGLVQAAAIIGVNRAIQLLADWVRGEPVQFRTSTFVNGLTLNARLLPRKDIEIVPLPLTTTELPRLPSHNNLSSKDYLGLTVLSLAMSASPALFRPKTGVSEATVRSHLEKDIDIDFMCDVLSLQANCHVSQSFLWIEYEEAGPFSLGDWQTWALGGNSFERVRWKRKRIDHQTGVVTIELHDDVSIASLDEDEVMQTIKTLQGADKKLRISVDRWKRSKRPNARLEDRYIDLRIALETLYLKDFVNEYSTEMRFRLPLFGAWYLGSTFEERRDIRKTLRDAYDTASGVVHSGEVSSKSKDCLEEAQELCRLGILKLLREGPPEDWGDLVLGACPS